MASVQLSSNGSRYGQDIAVRQFELVADEPTHLGGGDQGPTPTELLLAGLGSCKAITIKMYAERKSWPVENVYVAAELQTVEKQTVIAVYLTLVGDLTAEQRDRLREIGDRCPVHRLLSATTDIQTVLTPSASAPTEGAMHTAQEVKLGFLGQPDQRAGVKVESQGGVIAYNDFQEF